MDLWEPEAHEPAAHAQLSPQRQLTYVSETALAVCVLHESEDQTWQVKKVSLSALAADSGLNAVTVVVASAAHPGLLPLPLCTLSNPNPPLRLTLSVGH
jgi:hypothetical protein